MFKGTCPFQNPSKCYEKCAWFDAEQEQCVMKSLHSDVSKFIKIVQDYMSLQIKIVQDYMSLQVK